MKEILVRFLVGGLSVSLFAFLGDLFKPKSFAGLFGAAPSIALATLLLTVGKDGPHYAAIRSFVDDSRQRCLFRVQLRRQPSHDAPRGKGAPCCNHPFATLGRRRFWPVVWAEEIMRIKINSSAIKET